MKSFQSFIVSFSFLKMPVNQFLMFFVLLNFSLSFISVFVCFSQLFFLFRDAKVDQLFAQNVSI